MSGSVSLLPHTSSLYGAQLSTKTALHLHSSGAMISNFKAGIKSSI